MAFKIRQNPFSAGALPGTRWGSSRRSLDPIVDWEMTPPIRHRSTFGARHASPRIPARSTPMPTDSSVIQTTVVPYELYELYDWGKIPELLYNVIELYVFQNELLKRTVPPRQLLLNTVAFDRKF